MDIGTWQLNKKSFLTNICFPLLLIMPILLLTIPIISLGTDDIRMIKHFNQDEASLVEFAGKTYSKLFVPLEYNVTYPQFFYYLAGVILWPYTFLKGVNYQVIVIGLRCLGLLSASVSVIFIYFFCIKFFKSVSIGILSSLLFSTTPAYLITLLISRPHPLEILFILIVLYFCFSILERPSKNSLFKAVFFSGLATATKFGGLFLIPPLLLTYFYLVNQQSKFELIGSLKPRIKLIYLIVYSMLITSVFIPLFAVKLYLKFQDKFKFFHINNLSEFLSSRNFRLLLFTSIFLFLYFLCWGIINFFSDKFSKIQSRQNKSNRFLFMLNKMLLFLFYVIFANIAIFLLFNPAYFLFPMSNLKQMCLQFAKTTMGTSLDVGLNRPIFDFGGLLWLKMFFEWWVLGKWFGLLFLVYFFYEVLRFKRNWRGCKIFAIQRGLFWLYSLCLLSFLVIFASHKTHHYLIPISAVVGILISFAIFEIPKQFKFKLIKYPVFLIFSLILCLGFYRRATLLIDRYNIKLGNNNKETGILIGRWLEKNFDNNSKIWKDSTDFYIPPAFKNVSFKYGRDGINYLLNNMQTIDPDILVITNPYDSSLQDAKKIDEAIKEGLLKSFQLVKSFDYEGSYAKEGVYRKVFIYSRTRPIL